MYNNLKLSELVKQIIEDKKYWYSINKFGPDELKLLLDMSSTYAFKGFSLR